MSNVGTATINVTGTFYDGSGNALVPAGDSCAMLGGVLPAGDTCILSYGPGAVRCVVDGSSSKLRVVLMVSDIDGIIATEPATRK